jgi:hypothetical protein
MQNELNTVSKNKAVVLGTRAVTGDKTKYKSALHTKTFVSVSDKNVLNISQLAGASAYQSCIE